jgi:predicted  nucleic acid-binding Zn-ribbon protein
MDDTPVPFHDYQSPDRNLAWAFRKSRDNWKRKHQALKQDHKRLQNQLRDVRKSRQRWQQRAQQAEHEAQSLRAQLAAAQAALAQARDGGEKKGPPAAC